MNRYITPARYMTGGRAQQPPANDTIPGIYFDVHMAYLDVLDGCLDAPNYIPTGGQRAVDFDTFTLGVTHKPRAGVLYP